MVVCTVLDQGSFEPVSFKGSLLRERAQLYSLNARALHAGSSAQAQGLFSPPRYRLKGLLATRFLGLALLFVSERK